MDGMTIDSLSRLSRDFSSTSVSRGEALARRVEDAILGDELPAGMRLGTKAELRERFRVAASTLNEALRILQTRQLIDVRPGLRGGVFVSTGEPSLRIRNGDLRLRLRDVNVTNALAVRNQLEPLVAEVAATGHTPEDIAELHRLLDLMADHAHDIPSFVRSNWALHRRIAECGNNMVLRAMYSLLLDFVQDSVDMASVAEGFEGHQNETLRIHRELVDAIASGNPEAAVAAAHQHTPGVHLVSSDQTGLAATSAA